jgi:hypothetical protein
MNSESLPTPITLSTIIPNVPQAASTASIDSLLSATVDSIGLGQRLSEAKSLEQTSPVESARLFQHLAEQLRARGYEGHAQVLLERSAKLVSVTGREAEAAEIWLDIAQAELDSGFLHVSPHVMSSLTALSERMPTPQTLRFQLLRFFDGWYEDRPTDLLPLYNLAKELRQIDLRNGDIAHIRLAELALVDDASEFILEIFPSLLEIANATRELETRVRILLVLADMSGNWNLLVNNLNEANPSSRQLSLIAMRYGRWLIFHKEPEKAEQALQGAALSATEAGLTGDAAAALHNIRLAHSFYGPLDEYLYRGYLLIRSTSGGPTYFGRQSDARSVALEALERGNLPEAHRALRRHLYEGRLAAHVADELSALELLGDLYVKTNEIPRAVAHYIQSGKADKVKETAAGLAEVVPIRKDFMIVAPWQAAAGISQIEAQGDVVKRSDAEWLVPNLLMAAQGVRQAPVGPQVSLHAFEAIASIALQIPSSSVEDVLQLLEPLVEREPGHYRRTDRAMVTALAGIYRAHPNSRDRVGQVLLRCLADDGLARVATVRSLVELAGVASPLKQGLTALADEGNDAALEVLAYYRDRSTRVVSDASRRVAEFLKWTPDVRSSEWTIFDNLGKIAVYAALLDEDDRVSVARHLVQIAELDSELEVNRASALLGIPVLAEELPGEARAELFERAVRLAQSQSSLGLEPSVAPGSPRHRFSIDLGSGLLIAESVVASAWLARSVPEIEQVKELIARLLMSKDPELQRAAGAAVAGLTGEFSASELRVLSAHNSPTVRGGAAVQWTTRATVAPDLAEWFLSDTDRGVRAVVAQRLTRVEALDVTLAAFLRERLSQDKSAYVRWYTQNIA